MRTSKFERASAFQGAITYYRNTKRYESFRPFAFFGTKIPSNGGLSIIKPYRNHDKQCWSKRNNFDVVVNWKYWYGTCFMFRQMVTMPTIFHSLNINKKYSILNYILIINLIRTKTRIHKAEHVNLLFPLGGTNQEVCHFSNSSLPSISFMTFPTHP